MIDMDLIYKEWCAVAEHCEDTYGIQYDKEEEFFTCVECGEPIYFADYGDEVDPWVCPICGFNFLTAEMTDED
jgi:predicted RNA-binding Zn-ribbon protein involved in translation (DUF1610 family)